MGWLRDKLFNNQSTNSSPQYSFGGYSQPTDSGEVVRPETAITQATAFRCVDLISSTASQLPVSVMQRSIDGEMTEVPNAPALRFLKSPNGSYTQQEFIFSMMADKLVYGNSFWRIIKNGSSTQAQRLIPEYVDPKLNEFSETIYFYSPDSSAPIVYTSDEILHVRDFSVNVKGTSRLELCSELIGLGIAQDGWAARGYKKGGNLSGFFESDDGMSAEEANEFLEAFDKRYGPKGDAEDAFAVLPGGMKFNNIEKKSPADMELSESTRMTNQRIAGIFGVPVQMLGIESNNTFSSISQMQTSFYRDCMSVHIKALENRLTKSLRLPDNQTIQFDVSALLRGDMRNQVDILSNAVMNGWMTPNEAREQYGLPEMEDANELVSSGQSPENQENLSPEQADGSPSDSSDQDANAQPNNRE